MSTILRSASLAVALGLVAAASYAAEGGAGSPSVVKAAFGRMPDGTTVDRYTLTNSHGLQADVMTYGATLTAVRVPDREGRLANMTLYLDTFEDYLRGHPLFGSVVGRYANRIAGARVTLDGVEHALAPNAGKNHIHGGRKGFQKILWKARAVRGDRSAGVELTHTSPDGHEGYPGTLAVKVTYTLTDGNELRMAYEARSDKPTVVNLTNHAYWNLAGAGSGDVLGHVLTLNADRYLPADERKIPLGELRSVKDTPMDFTEPKAIGSRIREVEDRNYDHCYVLNKTGGERLSLAARVAEPKSGRVMEVYTTQPGVQLYTAKGLSSRFKAGGKAYGPYHGLCLETQHFPDSPNRPAFPSTVLRPGQAYSHVTIHKFGILEPD